MLSFKSIAVYCGSSVGLDPAFVTAAEMVSDYFVQQGIRLVNGGGSIGLMGIMADRILKQGGEAIGVIPIALKEKEVAHMGMTELIVVPDMHARKMTIVNISDAFIALPGGFGTLDELFETLTWSQLHLHNKPIGLLNVDHYFDGLLEMVDHMVIQGFVNPRSRSLLHSSTDIRELVKLLATPSERSVLAKWE